MGGRISIAGLVVAVLAAGSAIALLTRPSVEGSAAALVVAIVILLSSILGTIFRERGSRAFWAGFATFGWGWLLLSVMPEPIHTALTHVDGALESMGNRMFPVDMTGIPAETPANHWDRKNLVDAREKASTDRVLPFVYIAHTLLAIAFGLAGGLIGSYFHARTGADRRRETSA